ncbi:MAG: tautomerase family protein [Pseudomonadales bacterium]|nr:tautomerase family protein [Pseudomonadales bacterium]
MAQIKVYGVDAQLIPKRQRLSEAIHTCAVDALGLPDDKRAHRFFPIEKENFFMPGGRTEAYTIIEISMIAGRTTDTKKKLVRLLFDRINERVGIECMDLEICIYENPACNWGFRGMHGDELQFDYKIEV